MGCTIAMNPATGAPVRSGIPPVSLPQAPSFPLDGNVPRTTTISSLSSAPDSSIAGYMLSSTQSPTSAQGVFIVPAFYCTAAQSIDMQVDIGSGALFASGFVIVRCSGAGQPPVLIGIACATTGSCASSISISAGDQISIATSLTTTAAMASLRDVRTGQVSYQSGPGGSSNTAQFLVQSSSALAIPTFTTFTFSNASVNGLPLTSWTPQKFDMATAGTTEVRTGSLSSTQFSTAYVASEPCSKIKPQRAGNPSSQGGFGFDGLYRLGDNGTQVAPTSGPSSGPGPFAALGGVYADILNCSPWVQPGSSVTAWVMLQQFGNGNDHIQIGWEEFAGGKRITLVELQDPTDRTENPGKPFENCDDPSTLHELWCSSSPLPAAPVGTFTYYTILYQNNAFLLYMRQLGNTQPKLVAKVSNVEFKPNMASIFGETHSNYDQMPGTPGTPQVFESAEVFNLDSYNSWENFYGQTNYNGVSVAKSNTSFAGSANWYGLASILPSGGPHTKSGQMFKIWDTGS